MPSRQTISFSGKNSLTLSLKVRVGAIGTLTWIFSPSAMLPSTLVTVEFQRGKFAALVSSPQILLVGALMLIATAHSIRKVLFVLVALPFACVCCVVIVYTVVFW